MHSIWSGSISFGLVNIPIKLYSATGGTSLDFDLLHKTDLGQIGYKKFCKLDEKEVATSEIVKGYEIQKGQYVILSDDDFKKADVRKTRTIDIQEFTQMDQVDMVYYERPYFLEPSSGAEKSYILLREALKKASKIAIAKFVLRNREHLAAIKAENDLLVLNQLRFADEVRTPDELNIPSQIQTSDKEIDIALALIEQLTNEFNPKEFKDTYREELMSLIEEKAKGITPQPRGEIPQPTKIPDLMAVLQASLEKAQKNSGTVLH